MFIDTENTAPLYTVLENTSLELREDDINDGSQRENILKNAQITEEEYFVAPPGNIPLEQEKFHQRNQHDANDTKNIKTDS